MFICNGINVKSICKPLDTEYSLDNLKLNPTYLKLIFLLLRDISKNLQTDDNKTYLPDDFKEKLVRELRKYPYNILYNIYKDALTLRISHVTDLMAYILILESSEKEMKDPYLIAI